MISLKGPGLKIFAAILAVIALAFDFIDHENNKTTDQASRRSCRGDGLEFYPHRQ